MQARANPLDGLTQSRLDRLVQLSRRKPFGEATVMWTLVWGAFFVAVWIIDDRLVFAGTLGRVGLVLLLTGIAAGLFCWGYASRMQVRVDRAKSELKALAQEVSER